MVEIPFKRALISVYDKTGVVELAQVLHEVGCEIISTGSTAKVIEEAGIAVTTVDSITGFPECFDGRVKTLHPKIHGGILADRRKASHCEQMDELSISPIDLVVVNLYPFEATVASGANTEECIEQIDIGGPAMVRAAAKNAPSVAIVVNPEKYDLVKAAARKGGFSDQERQRLAAQAFAHTAAYDVAVAQWMGAQFDADAFCGATWDLKQKLRYGENPHQKGRLYAHGSKGLANARQLHGKEMSFNNYQDVDAAVRAAYDHNDPTVAIIKHANPCGIGVGRNIDQAYTRAHACDPLSAYGGVIATNAPVTLGMAQLVRPVFTEVIAAPGYDDDALELLKEKKNLRILVVEPDFPDEDMRIISGGLLVQERDRIDAAGDTSDSWTLVAGKPADLNTLKDLEFAWRAVRAPKSNAILLAQDGATVGIGMGQVNRVDSCRLAVERANTLGEGERARGAVAASDAFFPFADGLEILIAAGVKAVVEPGGSIRDDEVIAAAKKSGISLYFTGSRHFAH